MKLLVDCTPLFAGGGVQGAIALLVNLQGQGDVEWRAVVPELLRPALPPEVVVDRRIVFVQKRHAVDRVWLSYKLRRIEAEVRPDIVFTTSGPAYFCARAPHVVGFALPNLIYEPDGPLPRRTVRRKIINWLMRIALLCGDHFVVQTETVGRRLACLLEIDPARITVIGNCVNPILAHYAGSETSSSGRFGYLLPSTYYPHKNFEITPAVAAAMRQLDKELDFEFRFTLEPASFHWRRIVEEASRLGVADRFVTLGPLQLNELALAYQNASAVFLPTLREASTAVYPESFFFERPLVTSDIDFAHELCGDAALFVPPLEPDRIAPHLISLARSPELRAHLVGAGRKQLSQGYPSPEEKFKKQLDLLHFVLQHERCRARSIWRSYLFGGH